MNDSRLLTVDERVISATQDAFELAIDALHDTALQEALFRRLDKQLQTPVDQKLDRQQAIKHHHLQAHHLGLHNDVVFHAECETCYNEAVDDYRSECLKQLAAYNADEAKTADFLKCYVESVRFDQEENGHHGTFLHDDPRVIVAEFLGKPID